MFRFVRAQPNEFLVVSRRGVLRNLGIGRRALLGPGAAWVTVPSSKQEASFAMTQESADGIPLRFKGVVIFRVVDPASAAAAFDFAGPRGLAGLQELVAHVCLGELRDLVSQMTMARCIAERKSTLAGGVHAALERVAGGAPARGGAGGIALEIVQVAQVFIVDQELRAKLEAELRDQIAARSECSHIAMAERIEQARLEAARQRQREALADERAEQQRARERVRLADELERERIETEAPRRRLALERQRDNAALALEVRRLDNELEALAVEGELQRDRARQALEQEILPQRQVPEVAHALAEMFQGANLSLYGTDNALVGTLAPLVELLAGRLGGKPPVG